MNQYIDFINKTQLPYKMVGDEINMEFCPFCDKEDFHFFINSDTGLFDCKRCSESGNFYQLKRKLGPIKVEVQEVKTQPNDLPVNIAELQKNLWADDDAKDYVLITRGWNEEICIKLKIGLAIDSNGKKWLAIPHIRDNRVRAIKYRTIPPYLNHPPKREFKFTSGGVTVLYNQDCIQKEMEDILFLEGEGDVIAALSFGYPNRVIGLPGKDAGKAEWIEKLDQSKIGKIYFCLDNEPDSQKSAKALAKRIGLDRVYNIVLPEFTKEDGDRGKDINEWLSAGHSITEFEQLKKEAKKFNVDGIRTSIEIIEELERAAESGTLALPEFDFPWHSVNRLIGGCDRGNLVGITAPAKIGKTTTVLNWLRYLNEVKEMPAFMFCQEMRDSKLVEQLVSMTTQTPTKPMQPLSLSAITKGKCIALNNKAPLLFGYTSWRHTDEIFETIYQAYRRYGILVAAFDNLHLLSRDMKNTAQEISVLSKKFKDLGMELDILMTTIFQPKMLHEGQVASIYDSRGSAALVQDVDVGISLHRNRRTKLTEEVFASQGYIDQEEAFEPQMLFMAGATRYAPGGVTTLMFHGDTHTVTDFPQNEMEKAMRAVNKMDGDIVPIQV